MKYRNDVLLEKAFEIKRWERGIQHAYEKGIDIYLLQNLCSPYTRMSLKQSLAEGTCEFSPPMMKLIPKGKGEYRTVFCSQPLDRVFLHVLNDLLFETCGDFIHPSSLAYQEGISCAKIVRRVSREISEIGQHSEICGFKSDLSKYFDTVKIEYINALFDKIEQKWGKSTVIDILRQFYQTDVYVDLNGDVTQAYMGLRQGCPVASWLSNALLYEVDAWLSSLPGTYVRYSDDCLYVGEHTPEVFAEFNRRLSEFELSLNPKKVEFLSADRWFKFLGYSLKGPNISLSEARVKTFQKEVAARTIDKVKLGKRITCEGALHSVARYMYGGKHPWADTVLGTVNSKRDLDILNAYVMDCVRACETKKIKLGGLGVDLMGHQNEQGEGIVLRGTGKNVASNRLKTQNSKTLQKYKSIGCMQNAKRMGCDIYNSLVLDMLR